MNVRLICQVVAGIQLAALTLGLKELLRIFRAFQNASIGPYDPIAQERIIFWYEWRSGAASLADFGYFLKNVPVGAWMVFALLLVLVGSFFWRLWRQQDPDFRSRWLIAPCLLPLFLALAYYPFGVARLAALLHEVGLDNLLILADGAGEELAIPILGLVLTTAFGAWLLFLRVRRAPSSVVEPSSSV